VWLTPTPERSGGGGVSVVTRVRHVAAVLFVAVVLLTGCKDVSAPAAATQAGFEAVAEGPHNAFDVNFLQMMISHQRQGLEMLKLGKDKSVREDVVNLAGAIDVTEAEEVERMTNWLTGWNEKAVQVDRRRADRGPAGRDRRRLRDEVPEPAHRAPAQRGRDGAADAGRRPEHHRETARRTHRAVAHPADPADAGARQRLRCSGRPDRGNHCPVRPFFLL
jgi:hypothetical protein